MKNSHNLVPPSQERKAKDGQTTISDKKVIIPLGIHATVTHRKDPNSLNADSENNSKCSVVCQQSPASS